MKIQYHYAPTTGEIAKCLDGTFEKLKSWAERQELMGVFLQLRANGAITLKETINYDHDFFHGHSGRVDIYETV